ncbi:MULTISPECIES: hypothetical protein [unclassified Mucilaginibacter]|uniref:hypothetical protein n=1 Tax=unclassified Mucilaginibacter TaxID=2617802 RepID=UPI002AC9D208|nr:MULTISPECIES: hypothetical protein [unclassified Mucilaginibacter]MEB0263992.1 hypothetical protein [Mucilaginibacter sp. 10I4]MEB0280170.1 hypothetical protein [Mucilaginibacter sp. 10B2]MEB0303109.1 hypothetical protein [Mucilaginibacter sp. 5C4]WPX24421.1 hypothetical protein RHM67_03925 [Mucilaginibacter sp. 5C4]
MNIQEQIYNWLIIGLQQSPVRFAEVFYFDRRDKQFFSILMIDYFLFEADGEISKDATSTYSVDTLKLLKDRIARINVDADVIALPRLGDTEDNYLQQADSFLNLNAINIDEATIWEVEESGSITIKVD